MSVIVCFTWRHLDLGVMGIDGSQSGRHHHPTHQMTRTSVLNLLRLAEHLTNFVSVRGPPNKFPHFPGKISDDPLFSHFPPKFFSVRAPHKNFDIFPGKIRTTFLVIIFPNSLNYSGTSTKRITISICSLVSDSHQNISKFPILVAARQADVRGPPVGRGPQVENRCFKDVAKTAKI